MTNILYPSSALWKSSYPPRFDQ